MNYTVIAREEAPARGPERNRRRVQGMEALVAALEPGKVARIELADEEKPRAVTEQLFKTATRAGKLVDVWEVDGVLYAEIATPTA
ncbi:MAG: hypothetical protein M3Q10_15690 [Chloroflexota bacterium]|nr:hypothetical protein [Chloroflexota bacterium]